jgi:hypothetical protein
MSSDSDIREARIRYLVWQRPLAKVEDHVWRQIHTEVFRRVTDQAWADVENLLSSLVEEDLVSGCYDQVESQAEEEIDAIRHRETDLETDLPRDRE